MPKLRRRKKSLSEQADEVVETKRKIRKKIKLKEEDLVSTGCTLLNLALSDFTPYGGYALGTIVHIIGDTHTGKSLLALTMMAEAAINQKLTNYDLVYEEPESAMFFDIKNMFGTKAAQRVEFIPPKEKRKQPRTVQDWHEDLIKHEPPFIWVTDSFDALTSEDDLKDNRPTKGGFKTEKAGVASALFPKMVGKIEVTKSLFLWISQQKHKIGVTFGSPKTFTGGNAIKFYRSYEIWLATKNKIVRKVRGKDREVGTQVIAKITKNKFTGKVREVEFPVYSDYGVDDIGSMIDWMIAEGYWSKPKGSQKILTEDGFVDGTRDKIIRDIEENNLENNLKEVVAECWFDLEKAIRIDRKQRY